MKSAALKMAVVMAVGVMTAGQGFGIKRFDDGATHFVEMIYDELVWVDPGAAGVGVGTTVIVLPGGGVTGYDLSAYNDSVVVLDGGAINGNLNALHRSQITLNSGSISGDLAANNNSVVNLYGGTIGGGIYLLDASELIIHGVLCMSGDDVFGPGQYIELQSGATALSITFANGAAPVVYNINIPSGRLAAISLVVPEPATLSLLALGGLTSFRRRRLCS